MIWKLGALLLAGAILAGGGILLVLAGILVALITEPFLPFFPFFAPLALGILWLAGHLMGKVVKGMFPGHPDSRAWILGGWGAVIVLLGLWAWGVYDTLTSPIHWQ